MSKPVDQGGIGHVPTPEQTRAYYLSHVDQELFRSDVEHGDPQGRLINHILQSPQASAIIGKIPQLLYSSNPAMLKTISRPILQLTADGLWDQMKAAPKGELKESLYQAAQHMHYELHGKYRDQAAAESQPVSDRERALEARERAIDQRAQQARQSAEQAWIGNVARTNLAALEVEVDKALAPAKNLPPVVYQGLKDQYTAFIKSRISANGEGWKLLMNDIRSAARSNNPAAIDHVRDHYLRLARPEIRSSQSEFLKNAGITLKAASAARHSQLKSAAQQKSPSSTPAPVARSVQKAPAGPMSDTDYKKLVEREMGQALA